VTIGAMNNPGRDCVDEIRWIGSHGFDFLDLTLEPPRARPEDVDPTRIAESCAQHGLSIVGHTSPFLPIGSAYATVREAALREHIRALDVFAQLGVRKVTLHVDHRRGAESVDDNVQTNLWSFARFAKEASDRGMIPMLEQFGEQFAKVENLRRIFDGVPELRFHLDVAHANLWRAANYADELLDAFGDRLAHVHVSDNVGGKDDLHLPLGAGNIRWGRMLKLLRRCGYDDTITVEVFSSDRRYLLHSRDRLRALWDLHDLAPNAVENDVDVP